jgi:hypothetical protein
MHIASASGSGSRKQSAVVEGDGLLVWSAGTPVVNSGVAWEDPDDHPWLSVATLVAVAVSSPSIGADVGDISAAYAHCCHA